MLKKISDFVLPSLQLAALAALCMILIKFAYSMNYAEQSLKQFTSQVRSMTCEMKSQQYNIDPDCLDDALDIVHD